MSRKLLIELTAVLVKAVGISLSAIFGILGVLGQNHDANGYLTSWGLTACIGVLVGATVALAATGLEAYWKLLASREESMSRAAAQARHVEVVAQLSRATLPLEEVSLGLILRVPLDGPFLSRYREDLRSWLVPWRTKMKDDRLLSRALFIPFECPFCPIDPCAKEHPRRLEWFDFGLGHLATELSFFRVPVAPVTFAVRTKPILEGPDLHLRIYPKGLHFDVDEAFSSLQVQSEDSRAEKEQWTSRGTIAALPDLQGAQVFVAFEHVLHTGDDATDKAIDAIINDKAIELMAFRFSGVPVYVKEMLRHVDQEGDTFFEVRLPDKLQGS